MAESPISCIRCGYPVSAAADAARCPECGASVGDSRRHWRARGGLDAVQRRQDRMLSIVAGLWIVYFAFAIHGALIAMDRFSFTRAGQSAVQTSRALLVPQILSCAVPALLMLLPGDFGASSSRRGMRWAWRGIAGAWLVVAMIAIATVILTYPICEPLLAAGYSTLVTWLWSLPGIAVMPIPSALLTLRACGRPRRGGAASSAMFAALALLLWCAANLTMLALSGGKWWPNPFTAVEGDWLTATSRWLRRADPWIQIASSAVLAVALLALVRSSAWPHDPTLRRTQRRDACWLAFVGAPILVAALVMGLVDAIETVGGAPPESVEEWMRIATNMLYREQPWQDRWIWGGALLGIAALWTAAMFAPLALNRWWAKRPDRASA